MQYTIELTVAGCDTCCAHCYVNGGAAAEMPLASAYAAIEKIRGICALLPGEAAITLGNDLLRHSAAGELVTFAARNAGDYFDFNGESVVPTTGIALMARADRDALL